MRHPRLPGQEPPERAQTRPRAPNTHTLPLQPGRAWKGQLGGATPFNRIMELQNSLGWKGPQKSRSSKPLPRAGIPFHRTGLLRAPAKPDQGPHGEELPPDSSPNPAESRPAPFPPDPDPFPPPPPGAAPRAGRGRSLRRAPGPARGVHFRPRASPAPPSGGGGSEGVRKFKMAAAAEPEQRPPE